MKTIEARKKSREAETKLANEKIKVVKRTKKTH